MNEKHLDSLPPVHTAWISRVVPDLFGNMNIVMTFCPRSNNPASDLGNCGSPHLQYERKSISLSTTGCVGAAWDILWGLIMNFLNEYTLFLWFHKKASVPATLLLNLMQLCCAHMSKSRGRPSSHRGDDKGLPSPHGTFTNKSAANSICLRCISALCSVCTEFVYFAKGRKLQSPKQQC